MIKRNDPGLGYTVHGDAILLEPHAVQSSQPGDSLVCCRPPRHNLLIHARVRKAPRAKLSMTNAATPARASSSA